MARYLYDPFGNILSMIGPLADANLYRFSSKEVGLKGGTYYYGYRFYDSNLQRWASRDPIQEQSGKQRRRAILSQALAGWNLYTFCLNEPNGLTDTTGRSLWGIVKHGTSEAITLIGLG